MFKKLVAILLVLIVLLGIWANIETMPLKTSDKVTQIVIEKQKRTLTLKNAEAVLKVYKVSLGRNPVGAKEKEGDNKTPEGLYKITERKNDSAFHLALRLSYPEAKDVQNARIKEVRPGSDIMIHGMRNGFGIIGKFHLLSDWTAGCVALTNKEIEELWRVVSIGTIVEIRP